MFTLLNKYQDDTITLAECIELQGWIEAVLHGRVPDLEDLKMLVLMAKWGLRDKIRKRGGYA